MSKCCSTKVNYSDSKQFKNGKFRNEEVDFKFEFKKTASIFWDFTFKRAKDSVPNDKSEIPIVSLVKEDLIAMSNYSVIRLGHSSLVLKLDNDIYLTDPVFSNRASPFSFMGPKRFHESPININDLPKIKAIILSHNHYDHLDKHCVKKLKDTVERFYVPLGVENYLIKYGIPKDKITVLDWWESAEGNGISFTCTPAQHFSGRSLCDSNKTLWCSWVIKTEKVNLFFSGDSGYFKGFKKIGDLYGPFDMTFIEAGAYNKKWMEVHMMPEQTVSAHLDLKGKVLFPIHNGTFDLSLHSWHEPFEKIDVISKDKNIDVVFPIMGESIDIMGANDTSKWW